MTEILQIHHKMPNNRSYCKVCFHCHLTVGICSFLCNFGCNVFSQCLLNKTDLVFCFDLNLCLKSFLIIIVNFYIYLLITVRDLFIYINTWQCSMWIWLDIHVRWFENDYIHKIFSILFFRDVAFLQNCILESTMQCSAKLRMKFLNTARTLNNLIQSQGFCLESKAVAKDSFRMEVMKMECNEKEAMHCLGMLSLSISQQNYMESRSAVCA